SALASRPAGSGARRGRIVATVNRLPLYSRANELAPPARHQTSRSLGIGWHRPCGGGGACFDTAMNQAKAALQRLLPQPVSRLASEVLDHSLPARRRRLKRWDCQRLVAVEQERVVAMLVDRHGPIVQAGPFIGLKLPTAGSW